MNPKVSIFIVTYNQECYVKEALESVLMQKTNFEYEIVIGDDFSTDGTRNILLQYQRAYPGKFKLLFNETNIGISRNWMQTIMACSGKYIAMLEGDDYWINSDKLQIQVDFLEACPDYAMCFHNAKVIYEGIEPKEPHLMTSNIKDIYTLEDITQGWNIHTATVMFRNGLIRTFPDWCAECVFLDLPLFAMLAERGKVKFMNKVMSVYRKNAGSQILSRDYERINLGLVRMHQLLNRHLNFRYNRNLKVKMADELYSIAINKYKDGLFEEAGRYLRKSIEKQVSVLRVPQKYKLYLALKIYFPALSAIINGNSAVKVD